VGGYKGQSKERRGAVAVWSLNERDDTYCASSQKTVNSILRQISFENNVDTLRCLSMFEAE